MPMYRLGETIVRLYNPLPAVSMEEIVRDAGIEGLWADTHGLAFQLKFVWSQGPEREEITIDPGQYVELPVTVGNFAYSELNGVGLVLFAKDSAGVWPEPGGSIWRARCLEALQRARQFYLMRGSIPLSKARIRHGIQTDEQWETVKIKFKGGLINKAREDRIEAERKRLMTIPQATSAAAKIPVEKGAAA